MIYILDASFTGSQIIPDEKNPQADKMFDEIKNADERYAPHLLWYEIANIFMNLIRRRRYAYNEVIQFFPVLTALDITADFASGINYSEKLLRLCTEFSLSSYDAAYLELAERKNAALCTLDEGLWAAAKKRGVAVLK